MRIAVHGFSVVMSRGVFVADGLGTREAAWFLRDSLTGAWRFEPTGSGDVSRQRFAATATLASKAESTILPPLPPRRPLATPRMAGCFGTTVWRRGNGFHSATFAVKPGHTQMEP